MVLKIPRQSIFYFAAFEPMKYDTNWIKFHFIGMIFGCHGNIDGRMSLFILFIRRWI